MRRIGKVHLDGGLIIPFSKMSLTLGSAVNAYEYVGFDSNLTYEELEQERNRLAMELYHAQVALAVAREEASAPPAVDVSWVKFDGEDTREGLELWLCRAEYKRPGPPIPGDRIVRCGLPKGHDGDHDELIDGVVGSNTWPRLDPLVAALVEAGQTTVAEDEDEPLPTGSFAFEIEHPEAPGYWIAIHPTGWPHQRIPVPPGWRLGWIPWKGDGPVPPFKRQRGDS